MDLNRDQISALSQMIWFLSDASLDKFFLLNGSAGTGKTFTVVNSLLRIRTLYPYKRICLTAPTNKAVQILRESCHRFGIASVDCMTIYRLLALQAVEGENGEVLLQDKHIRSSFNKYDVIYIDEASMVGLKLWVKILNEVAKWDNKVILVGDEAQLTPVGEGISPALKVNNQFKLTTIVRQAENSPLMSAISAARQLVYNPNGEWNMRSLIL